VKARIRRTVVIARTLQTRISQRAMVEIIIKKKN
jgi:hypothetical protein